MNVIGTWQASAPDQRTSVQDIFQQTGTLLQALQGRLVQHTAIEEALRQNLALALQDIPTPANILAALWETALPQADRDLIAAITLAVRCSQVDSSKLPPRFQKRGSWLTVVDTADTNVVWNRPIPPLQAKFSATLATANDASPSADILQSPFSEVRLADVAMPSTPTMTTTVQVKLSPESQSLNESNRESKKQIALLITHLRHSHSSLSNPP